MLSRPDESLSRRGALGSLALLAGGPGVVWLLVSSRPQTEHAAVVAKTWTWDVVARGVVGLPVEDMTKVALTGGGPAGVGGAGESLAKTSERWRSLRDAIEGAGRASREDFKRGRVQWIEGWMLSPTDIALCALAAAQSSPEAG